MLTLSSNIFYNLLEALTFSVINNIYQILKSTKGKTCFKIMRYWEDGGVEEGGLS